MFRVGAVRPMRRVLVVAALAVLGACGDQRPTEPAKPATGGSLDGLLSSGPKLVECHIDETKSTTALIDAGGGTVALDGTSVLFPLGALAGPTIVTLTIPASRYIEVAIQTDGQRYFPVDLPQPVVTIDYSRCNRSDVLVKPLMVWYIDSETKALLENMDVLFDNKLLQRITFSTGHFSGYAIAF
jgi:hypothetical protein